MGTETISYPIDRMQQVAQQIKTNAQQSYTHHTHAWRQVEALVDRFPGFMQSALRSVLDPHDRRFRESYQWQMDFADRLARIASEMAEIDKEAAQRLNP